MWGLKLERIFILWFCMTTLYRCFDNVCSYYFATLFQLEYLSFSWWKRQRNWYWDMDSSIYKKNKTHIDILFIIIALFVICHFPRCFLKFYEVFYEPFWIKVLGTIERLLLIIHFSANSFIYMIKNDTFRKHIFLISKKLFCLLTIENRADV